MPLSLAVYNILKEKLGDVKYPESVDGKEITMIDWIAGDTGIFEKADHAIKIQKINEELKAEKVKAESDLKAAKESLAKVNADYDAIKKDQLTPEQKAALKKGMTEEAEARLNAAVKAAEEAKAQIQALTTQLSEKDVRAVEMATKAATAEVEKKMLAKLTAKKIVGKNAELAVLNLKNSGNIKVVRGEDGTFSEKYYITENGKLLEATPDQIVDNVVKEFPALVSGTGDKGAGQHHSDSAPGAGNTGNFSAMMRTMRT